MALALGGAALAGSLAGCETTAEKSARLEKTRIHTHLAEQGLTITKQSADVHVLDATLVHGSEGSAAVVTLRNDSGHTLKGVPIAITVKDVHGSRTTRRGWKRRSRRWPRCGARRSDVGGERPGPRVRHPAVSAIVGASPPERTCPADRSEERALEQRKRRHRRSRDGAQPLERRPAEPRRLRARAPRRHDRRGGRAVLPEVAAGRVGPVSGFSWGCSRGKATRAHRRLRLGGGRAINRPVARRVDLLLGPGHLNVAGGALACSFAPRGTPTRNA